MIDTDEWFIDGYSPICAVSAGPVEIVFAFNPEAEPGERYMCTNCSGRGFLTQYSETLVSDDYVEILNAFGQRITEQCEKLRDELSVPEKNGIDDRPVFKDGFVPVTYEDDLNEKVIVIKPEVLKPEYQRATRQYQLCTGGFGASPNSRGSACYCTNLYSGEKARFERMDVLGIVPKEELPDWAKAGLERIELQRSNDLEAR